jgi:hypothetical protein
MNSGQAKKGSAACLEGPDRFGSRVRINGHYLACTLLAGFLGIEYTVF